MGRPAKDIVGQTFNRLRVISRAASCGGAALWNCECVCGTVKAVVGQDLRSGVVQSCGCLRRNQAGLSRTRAYRAWQAMHTRCDPQHKDAKYYAAKGITVCAAWAEFEKFYADMGSCPAGHQLDREKNDQGYSPKNCRWVTRKINMRNRSISLLVPFGGVLIPIMEACEKTGINYNTLLSRFRRGSANEDKLYRPARKGVR